MLHIYAYEGCPFCARVRAALGELALDAVWLPCPPGGTRFRAQAQAVGGMQQFPFLVDTLRAKTCYESAEIIRYVADHYPRRARTPCGYGAVGRAAAETLGTGAAWPPELFSDESSTAAARIRRLLCIAEQPFVLRSVGGLAPEAPVPAWVSAVAPSASALTRPPVPTWIDAAAKDASFAVDAIIERLSRRYH